MQKIKSTPKTRGLATPANVNLLSSYIDNSHINEVERMETAKEILSLLNKTPDEMIRHFIANEDFDKAKELLKMFFPKVRKECEIREQYYMLMYEQIGAILKDATSSNPENIAYWRGARISFDHILTELLNLFDDVQDKTLFLKKVHRLCIELLEMKSTYADQVVVDMVKYFGEWGEMDDEKHLEFVLTIPSALIKQKVESMKDKTPLFALVDFAENMILPQGEKLRDSERSSIYYDEEKKEVKIRPNKNIAYHVAEGQGFPQETGKPTSKEI